MGRSRGRRIRRIPAAVAGAQPTTASSIDHRVSVLERRVRLLSSHVRRFQRILGQHGWLDEENAMPKLDLDEGASEAPSALRKTTSATVESLQRSVIGHHSDTQPEAQPETQEDAGEEARPEGYEGPTGWVEESVDRSGSDE